MIVSRQEFKQAKAALLENADQTFNCRFYSDNSPYFQVFMADHSFAVITHFEIVLYRENGIVIGKLVKDI